MALISQFCSFFYLLHEIKNCFIIVFSQDRGADTAERLPFGPDLGNTSVGSQIELFGFSDSTPHGGVFYYESKRFGLYGILCCTVYGFRFLDE